MTRDGMGDRIDELFLAALELPNVERREFVERETESDPLMVRERVLELLEAEDDVATEFAACGPLNLQALSAENLPDAKLGRQVADYVIEERIAAGGFGTVYRAARKEPYEEVVAIKLLHAENLAAPPVVQRVLREMQALSDLRHPYIVSQLQAGLTDDGEPYIVMEYVDGLTLNDHCDKYQLSIEERLQLFQEICEAVDYAHQREWVHRDLKPSNILVTADGTPKLLDFGIAKLSGPPRLKVEATLTQGIIGTPQYMSPEQILGRSVGPQADVYALGAILYELLSGHRAFDVMCDGVEQLVLDAIQQAVREKVPRRPSTMVTDGSTATGISKELVAERRQSNPSTLRRCLEGDIDNIAMMALRKEPTRRYASAVELKDDIQRWMEHRPVQARPDSLSYRTRKFLQRNRVPVLVACLFGLCAAIGIAAVGFGRQAISDRDLEEARRHVESAHKYFDQDEMPFAVAELYRAYRMAPLDSSVRSSTGRLIVGWAKHLGMPLDAASSSLFCFSPNSEGLAAIGKDGMKLWRTRAVQSGSEIEAGESSVGQNFSEDSEWFFAFTEDHQLRVWNTASKVEVRFDKPPWQRIIDAWIRSDVVSLLTVTQAEIQLWSNELELPAQWRLKVAKPLPAGFLHADFVGERKIAARLTEAGEKRLELWDANSLQQVGAVPGAIENFANWASTEGRLAVSYKQQGKWTSSFWNTETNEQTGCRLGRIVGFDRQGDRALLRSKLKFVVADLASADEPRSLTVMDPRDQAIFIDENRVLTASMKLRPTRHIEVTSLDLDGQKAGPVRHLFHAEPHTQTRLVEDHEAVLGHDFDRANLSQNGRFVLFHRGKEDGKEKPHDLIPWLWDLRPTLSELGHIDLISNEELRLVDFDEDWLVAATDEDVVSTDLVGKKQFRKTGRASSVAFGANCELVAIGKADGSIELTTPDLQQATSRSFGQDPIQRLVFDREGKRLFAMTPRTLYAIDVPTNILEWRKANLAQQSLAATGSPFSDFRLGEGGLTVSIGDELWLVDEFNLDVQHKWDSQEEIGSVDDAVVTSNGVLVSRLRERKAYLTGRDGNTESLPHRSDATTTAISRNGNVVALGYADGSVQTWDTKLRKPLMLRLPGSSVPVAFLSFSSDGSRMAATYANGDYRVWATSFELKLDENELEKALSVLIGWDLSSGTELGEAKLDRTQWNSRYHEASQLLGKLLGSK